MRKLIAALFLLYSFCIVSGISHAGGLVADQVSILSEEGIASVTVANLPAAASATNKVFLVIDGNGVSDCTVGGGSDRNLCTSNGTAWSFDGDGAGAGQAVIFDIGDDGGDDSTDLGEIATTGDTNTIFTEPAADKLLIAVANNWPTADAATALSANGANCAAGEIALGVGADGAVEGCYEPAEADISDLAHVTNYVTNNAADIIAGALTINPGTLFLEEQAEASAPVAGQGQIWVDLATPNTLWFTNDADTDVQLGIGGGSGAFSDAGDPVVLNTTTKDVVIGTSAVNTSKLSIDGDADQVQLTVQCDATQTDSCIIVENSAGTEVINLENNGDVKAQSIQDVDGPGTNWSIDSAGAAAFSSVAITPSATPSIDFDDSDDTGTIESSININCPTTNDCDMDFSINSGADTETPMLRIDTETGGASQVEIGITTVGTTPTNATIVSETGAITQTGTATFTLQDGSDFIVAANANAGPYLANDGDIGTGTFDLGDATQLEIPNSATYSPGTTSGQIGIDTTITDHNGLVRYYDGATEMAVVAVDVSKLLSTDNFIIKYDAVSNDFGMEADAGAAGGDSISIDSVAVVDPDFVSTGDIDFVDTSNTITANINAASIIEPDLDADVAAVDGDFLTYDSTGTNFTWRSPVETLSDIGAEGTLTNSAGLLAALSDETGTGVAVFGTTPTLTTPVIGVATGTSLALTGNLTATIPVTITTGATLALSVTNTVGNMHMNGDADAIDYTLPGAAAGLSACFHAGEFTGIITIDPVDGTDTIYLNGVSVGAGDAIDSPGTVGDMICLFAVDATKWYTAGQINVWVDGGVD